MCVCSLHFAPENFAQGKLKKSAIPDTNLPPTKETTLHNDFIQMSQDVVASEYQHMTEALVNMAKIIQYGQKDILTNFRWLQNGPTLVEHV